MEEPQSPHTDFVFEGPEDARELLGGLSSPPLRNAALRVVERWVAEEGAVSVRDPVGRDVAEGVATVAFAAEKGGDPCDPGADSAAQRVLRRRLVDALRAELLRAPPSTGEEPDARELVEVVRRLEEVREILEPERDEDFAGQLLGPTGLELTVEVSHDLRSPLSSILFLSETLRNRQSGDLNDVQRRQVGLIYSAALSMLSIVSDVTELCRGGDQLAERERSPFSVSEVLASVREVVMPMAEEKGVAFRTSPPDREVRRGHPVALSRVLLNLASNAIKFTDDGFVEMRAREEDFDRVRFEVRDTGPGIPAERQEKLYQTFRMSDRKRGVHFSGTGLGLTIARKLVRAMGGELSFETRQGEGTTFRFTLRLPPADSPE